MEQWQTKFEVRKDTCLSQDLVVSYMTVASHFTLELLSPYL